LVGFGGQTLQPDPREGGRDIFGGSFKTLLTVTTRANTARLH